MSADVLATRGDWPNFREHPLEFVLRLFGDVRPGEAMTVLLLTANVFLLLTAYYLLKVAREPLILLGGGAEVKSYAAVGQSILLVLVANVYGWLAAHGSAASSLIACVTLFFAAQPRALLGARHARRAARRPVLPVGRHLQPRHGRAVLELRRRHLHARSRASGSSRSSASGARSAPSAGRRSPIGSCARARRFFLMLVAAGILVVDPRAHLPRAPPRDVPGGGRDDAAHDEPLGARQRLRARASRSVPAAARRAHPHPEHQHEDGRLRARPHAHRARGCVAAPRPTGSRRPSTSASSRPSYFEWINVLEVVLQSLVVSRVIKYAGLRVALAGGPARVARRLRQRPSSRRSSACSSRRASPRARSTTRCRTRCGRPCGS